MDYRYYWMLYWLVGEAVVYWIWTSENRWAKDKEPSEASKAWIKLQEIVEEFHPVAIWFVVLFLWVLWPVFAFSHIWWSVKRLIQGKKV